MTEVVGALVLWAIVAYVLDVTQTRHAIRRNYPVIGRFRYFFEHLGEFFRQYFFAMDREELPFNRAERSWVYRAAKHVDTTVAFGSTRDLRPAGTTIFVNCAFPTLGADAVPPGEVRVSVVKNDGKLSIQISDTGPGIPAAHHEDIFNPFFTTKEFGLGSGLGLSISRNNSRFRETYATNLAVAATA